MAGAVTSLMAKRPPRFTWTMLRASSFSSASRREGPDTPTDRRGLVRKGAPLQVAVFHLRSVPRTEHRSHRITLVRLGGASTVRKTYRPNPTVNCGEDERMCTSTSKIYSTGFSFKIEVNSVYPINSGYLRNWIDKNKMIRTACTKAALLRARSRLIAAVDVQRAWVYKGAGQINKTTRP